MGAESGEHTLPKSLCCSAFTSCKKTRNEFDNYESSSILVFVGYFVYGCIYHAYHMDVADIGPDELLILPKAIRELM